MTGRNYNDPSAGFPPVGDEPDRACADVDSKVFFPEPPRGGGSVSYSAALAVCRRCPHIDPCRDWVLETRQDHGVWGGTTPEERKAIRKAAS